MEHKQSNLFDVLSPAQTFVFGIVAGIMTLCTFGFFILLGMVLTGGASVGGSAKTPSAVVPTAQQPTTGTAPRAISIEVDEKNDHILGDKNAKVTIVEFSDADCPFCATFHPTMKQVLADYKGDVRWVFRHFPLESLHPNARTLANAAECAADQGKFWEFNDALYAKQGSYRTADALTTLAKDLGLNTSKFSSCLEKNQFDSVIETHMEQAAAAGCTGTPCSIIIDEDGNTTPINGAFPLDRVKAIIDPLL